MARDRLAAMRAQQQQRGGEYDTSDSYRNNNPYAQQDDKSYELTDVQNSSSNLVMNSGHGNNGGGDVNAFYDEIAAIQDSIKNFNDKVAKIGDLHSRSLNNTDEAAAARVQEQLDGVIEETRALSSELKNRIKNLERQGGGGPRRQQTALVKQKFLEAIQGYQTVEQQFRQRYKQRMERQFKIVKPDATPEEVKAVVDDVQGGQIFQQALMSSNRYGESRVAYREVQERHEEIMRIEQTLTELAQLFNDMSILVEQQNEQIDHIEATAGDVEKDMEVGVGYTDKAVASARAARKKRWICFGITIVLLIIIAIVVAVEVVKRLPKKDSGGNQTQTVTQAATSAAVAAVTSHVARAALPLITPLARM